MLLTRLPTELVLDILKLAIYVHPNPVDILVVNTQLYQLCLPLLHSDLTLKTMRQLQLFSEAVHILSYAPRSLTVVLAGGNADFRLFGLLRRALIRCRYTGTFGEQKRENLKEISFRLNSLASDPNLNVLYDALTSCNPESFSWTGPDPEHHFSIAIVPGATTYLCLAIKTWTNLRHLKLTNLAFSYIGVVGDRILSDSTLVIPSLTTIYLGQITFLDPKEIARMVCGEGLKSLQEIRLVDTYRGSIWGLRIKMMDIENALNDIVLEDDSVYCSKTVWILKARQLVKCEAKTERIVGGDRMDTNANIIEY